MDKLSSNKKNKGGVQQFPFLTRREIDHALEYINKRIEGVKGPPNFFTFGKIVIPDRYALDKAKRIFFIEELKQDLVKVSSKFKRNCETALLSRLSVGKDVTVVIKFFSDREKESMVEKGFPILQARSGASMIEFPEFLQFLKEGIQKKMSNDFENSYLNFLNSLTDIELLAQLPFDRVKKKELELINSVKSIDTEGIRFGVNTDFQNNFEKTFKPSILLPESHYSSMTQTVTNYLDDTTIFDLLQEIASACYIQASEKKYFIDNSIDKEWSKKYFEFKEKDYYCIEVAINSLDGYQGSKILLR